ncbi:MAG: hypothetical protein JWN51_1351 [Phycisphaerales bacterium]|nr:hypothetical protein [Phycisphaerales bacterium]
MKDHSLLDRAGAGYHYFMRWLIQFLGAWAMVIPVAVLAADVADVPIAKEKPKVAVFPLGGTASAELREKVGFSLRLKLERDGTYEPIDGPTMAELAGEKPVMLATGPEAVKALAEDQKPAVLIWGELNADGSAVGTLKLKVLDLREKDAKPEEMSKAVAKPTDMRFVVEKVLESLKGVKAFEHPSEAGVTDDPEARRLWKKNPNLVPAPNFAEAGKWTALYMEEKYAAPVSDKLPATDKVCIYRLPEAPEPAHAGAPRADARAHNVLAMRLSKECAENNGLACLSELIKIEPETRYRIQFKYKSDGPNLHVFVKGYTDAPDINGHTIPREVYKRQVPPSGGTDGRWVTVVDDLNPQNHQGFPVKYLRVDLYAYLAPGVVMFDDVRLKAVGAMTHRAKVDALEKGDGIKTGNEKGREH